jgi:hypothetical protein
LNDDVARAADQVVDFCDCTHTQSERGETCGLPVCPDAPGRRRTLLHPRLDMRGRARGAVPSELGRWDGRVLCLFAVHPGFEPDDFAWVGTERLGGGICVSIYSGMSAESPYLCVTEDEEDRERFLVRVYVGGADGEEPDDPFLVSECGDDDLARESLRMIDSARSYGMSARILVFKREADVEGEPIGPAVLVQVSDGGGDRQMVGVPFVPKCVCERPVGSPGERCGCCGDEIDEPWVTLTQARARARRLGIGLRET